MSGWDSDSKRYGHYEDDEEEFEDVRPHTEEPATEAASLAGEGLVTVRLGEDMLPVEIQLQPSWKHAVAPEDYGQSVLAACKSERLKLALSAIESGRRVSAMPTRRQRMLALLRCRSIEEFRRVYDALTSNGSFQGAGRALSEYGNPVVEVHADRNGVRDVLISATWGEDASIYEIEGELRDCVEEIRRQLHAATRTGIEVDLTDDELVESVAEHRLRLLRQ